MAGLWTIFILGQLCGAEPGFLYTQICSGIVQRYTYFVVSDQFRIEVTATATATTFETNVDIHNRITFVNRNWRSRPSIFVVADVFLFLDKMHTEENSISILFYGSALKMLTWCHIVTMNSDVTRAGTSKKWFMTMTMMISQSIEFIPIHPVNQTRRSHQFWPKCSELQNGGPILSLFVYWMCYLQNWAH